jgi:hypothetical protein
MLWEAPGYLKSCLQYGTYSWLGTNVFMVSSKLDSTWPPPYPSQKYWPILEGVHVATISI